jgi:hypothetical protein
MLISKNLTFQRNTLPPSSESEDMPIKVAKLAIQEKNMVIYRYGVIQFAGCFLQMEACFAKISVNPYWNTWSHIPEDGTFQNLKSNITVTYCV